MIQNKKTHTHTGQKSNSKRGKTETKISYYSLDFYLTHMSIELRICSDFSDEYQ